METKTKLTEQEGVARVQELAKEAATKAAAPKASLAELFKEKTTGKIQLPRVTPRGTALIELAASSYPEDRRLTSIEQMLMILWALKSQDREKAKRVFELPAEDIRDEIDMLFDQIDSSELEEYVTAVEQALGVFEEEVKEKAGNVQKGKKARKMKATRASGK